MLHTYKPQKIEFNSNLDANITLKYQESIEFRLSISNSIESNNNNSNESYIKEKRFNFQLAVICERTI